MVGVFSLSMLSFFIYGSYMALVNFGFIPELLNIFSGIVDFYTKNYMTILLILSEVSALLPGPWNGILHALFRILARKSRSKNHKH